MHCGTGNTVCIGHIGRCPVVFHCTEYCFGKCIALIGIHIVRKIYQIDLIDAVAGGKLTGLASGSRDIIVLLVEDFAAD